MILVWVLGAIVGIAYSQQQHIPPAVALPVLAAMLLELTFYMSMAFPEVCRRWEALGGRLPLAMTASAVLPYLVCAPAAGIFSWNRGGLLVLCAAAVTHWFRLFRRGAAAELGFLALVASVYLAKAFLWIYPPPVEGVRIDALGQLMWIRLGVGSALWIGRAEGTGFGFWPRRHEWAVGLRHFVLLMPLAVALLYGLEFGRFGPPDGWWWKGPATFAGILWVVALGEEFFFRGILQPRLSGWLGVRIGLVATSVLFGAAHLPFREFPNWRFAVLAAVAGWFYGRAFLLGGGIRAAMVAHALTVACWRTFFR